MSAITAKASRKMKKYAVLTREPRCFLGSFDFSWEQRKFSELVQIERGGSPRPIDDFITDAPNGLNWVKIGDAPTQGNYITKTAEKIRPEGLSKTREVHPGDLILSNSMSFGKPYIMGIDGCIHDGWLLIRNTYGVFDLTFLCHLLGTPQLLSQYRSLAAGSTVNNLNKELVGNTYVTIPSITEQRVLGAYLEQLDNLITLHQRKCANLCSPSRVVFSLLFATSTFSWEQRKFDEVFDCTVPNNTLSRAELSYDEGTVLNVHYGDVLIKYGSVLDVQKDDIPRIPHRCREDFNGALLQDGDVIIADTAEDETTGKACEIGNLQGSAIVSGLHTMVCRPRNRMALGYLGYYLNSNAYHHQLLPLMQGIKVLSLSRSNIQKTSVSYPIAVKEQQLIAYYFSQLDNLITLHQRECISFTGKSVGLIQAINKKQITSSWEQRKLGDISEIKTGPFGSTLHADDYVSDGTPIITTEHFKTGALPRSKNGLPQVSDSDYKRLTAYTLDDGDIVFSRVGSVDINALITPFQSNWLFSGRVLRVRPQTNISSQFLHTRLETESIKTDIRTRAVGQTMPSINTEILKTTPLVLPSSAAEQEQIGSYFAALDNLITLHQRKPFLMKWRTSDANRNQTNRLVL